MSSVHILSIQKKLIDGRHFLRSLLTTKVPKRKFILEKASRKELKLLQTLISLFVKGEIPINQQFLKRLKSSKKLSFLETNFKKICSDPSLKQNFLFCIFNKSLFEKEMSSFDKGVETFVILPFTRYKALDQKSKKVDPPAEPEPMLEYEASPSPEVEPPPAKQVNH